MEFLGYSVIIKIACAGMFFAIFLRSTYHRNDISITIFSVLYALCAYSLGYYWCVMWLDCVALLPLIILGLNKLIDEGKYKLFTISLALALISNYYIGVFICIFVALYYIVAYLTRYSAFDYKALLKTTGRVLLFSLIGVGIACVIILPTWNALQLSYAATNTAPKEMEIYLPRRHCEHLLRPFLGYHVYPFPDEQEDPPQGKMREPRAGGLPDPQLQ